MKAYAHAFRSWDFQRDIIKSRTVRTCIYADIQRRGNIKENNKGIAEQPAARNEKAPRCAARGSARGQNGRKERFAMTEEAVKMLMQLNKEGF